MSFKIIVSDPEEGQSWQVEKEATALIGSKIGEEFNGDLIGLNGYTLKITGGSDKEGFPMRRSVRGTGRRKILMESGPGYKPKENGARRRKSVRGNTVSEEVVQLNTKVTDRESDAEPVPDLLGIEVSEETEGEAEEEGEEEETEEESEEPEETEEEEPEETEEQAEEENGEDEQEEEEGSEEDEPEKE